MAEYNVAHLRHPVEAPRSAGFVDNLDRINALAERTPGFLCRHADDCRDPADQTLHGDPLVVATLSIWRDLSSLRHFVHNTVHGRFYRQRADWFEAISAHNMVIWDVEDGTVPTLAEAQTRLAHRREHGDTPQAYGWDGFPQAAALLSIQRLNGAAGAAEGMAHG